MELVVSFQMRLASLSWSFSCGFYLICIHSLQVLSMMYLWLIGPVWWNAVWKLCAAIRPTVFCQIIHWSILCAETEVCGFLLSLYQRKNKTKNTATLCSQTSKNKQEDVNLCYTCSNQWFKVICHSERDKKQDSGEHSDYISHSDSHFNMFYMVIAILQYCSDQIQWKHIFVSLISIKRCLCLLLFFLIHTSADKWQHSAINHIVICYWKL